MKKAGMEALLLLASVYERKRLGEIIKDLKALDTDGISLALTRVEDVRNKSLAAIAEGIGIELEKQAEAKGTAVEVQYLLLTRYKIKVPTAAERLSEELAKIGYSVDPEAARTKANFTKWIRQICDELPRDKVMAAALSVRPN